jgi:BirA family biotin operon repressor/biotin-[acetyl-CoA-carboxylase] ligase
MKTDERLLQYFVAHEGQYISGETLAQIVGISRAGVWKAIQKLIDQGHQIDRQHRRGYRYQFNQALSAQAIATLMTTEWSVRVFDTLDSTNTYAKQALATGDIQEPTVVIANQQTHGRGRLGRVFEAPSHTGLYISFALPVARQEVVVPGLLTTSTAVAVADMVQSIFQQQLQFKWVNDLLWQNRKVGGILTEAIADFESQSVSALVVGIGLNLTEPAQGFPADIADKAGVITADLTVSRNIVAATLIDRFAAHYARYRTGEFLPHYRQHNIVLGQEVTVQHGREALTGVAQAIDDEGQLVVMTDKGQQTIGSGEILKLNVINGPYQG